VYDYEIELGCRVGGYWNRAKVMAGARATMFRSRCVFFEKEVDGSGRSMSAIAFGQAQCGATKPVFEVIPHPLSS
jgi:hypothetical protein